MSILKSRLVDENTSKVLCINGKHHFETNFEYSKLVKYKQAGWFVYVINSEGVWFFTANSENDGNDFTKITIR